MSRRFVDSVALVAGFTALTGSTAAFRLWLGVSNPTIVALAFLLLVLVVAAIARLWVAVVISTAAMLAFNYFFLPPIGTWTIADPQNWVALFTFLAVSLVASNLSASARARAQEAHHRRDELSRLFDLSRDVLVMTDAQALNALARSMATRFRLVEQQDPERHFIGADRSFEAQGAFKVILGGIQSARATCQFSAEALSQALVEPCVTCTDAGTVTTEALLASPTVVPPAH